MLFRPPSTWALGYPVEPEGHQGPWWAPGAQLGSLLSSRDNRNEVQYETLVLSRGLYGAPEDRRAVVGGHPA